MKRVRRVTFVVAAFVVLGSLAVRAQDTPKLPLQAGTRPSKVLVVDDQIFDADAVVFDKSGLLRPYGATTDTRDLGWGGPVSGTKFQGWEGGVLPVEFDATITQSQRDQFMGACAGWGKLAPVMCVERTSQLGYVHVTAAAVFSDVGTCNSIVGQSRELVQYTMNLPAACFGNGTNNHAIYHELGHAFGFIHEHQRQDRSGYIAIDLSNVKPELAYAFDTLSLRDPLGSYDFESIMHYTWNAFAIDATKPSIVPQAGYGSHATTMGTSLAPTDLDHQALKDFYSAEMRPLFSPVPRTSPTTHFDRTEFLAAMERLHAFYFSRYGLNRPSGLSINGKPDFLGIATWIFDVYLAARSRGFLPEQAFGIVFADLTQSDEWRQKHPGQTPLTRPSFTPLISLDRAEFLDALQKLDAFYASADGLQRPNGLSIANGPDFLGIAAWIFDIYLSERLSGSSRNVAWARVVNAIQDSDEWKRKH